MSLHRWDDELKYELLRLKSELKPENFRVLHHPMGIGKVTKRVEPAMAAPKAVKAPNSATKPASLTMREAASTPSPSSPAAKKPRSAARVILAHAFDIAFVSLTVALGLLLAIWVVDPQHFSNNPELLKKAMPVQLLSKNSALALVAGLYAFFSLYWLFFKFVSGSTLGESFLDNFRSLQNPRERASGKGSADS